MKIITYSDLHLEFGTEFLPPTDSTADVMVLAGDIITFRDFTPLDAFLKGWRKPVLFITGNHEYYNGEPIKQGNARFKAWLAEHHPNVIFLQDEAVTIGGVHFFGGTMWTNFNDGDKYAMDAAWRQMNDYRRICTKKNTALDPMDTIIFHEAFVKKLQAWLRKKLTGARVVISHHAPVVNPHTQYGSSQLMPAFNSLDMLPIIEKYQPALWVYGHTHECDDQTIGNTRIISNQLGYPQRGGGFECRGFDAAGLMTEIESAND
jgi:predicted phosphodiesterase